MAKSINWQKNYENLVAHIKAEYKNAGMQATKAFRRWEYGIDGASHDEFALFDAIERELDAILSYSEGLIFDSIEDDC